MFVFCWRRYNKYNNQYGSNAWIKQNSTSLIEKKDHGNSKILDIEDLIVESQSKEKDKVKKEEEKEKEKSKRKNIDKNIYIKKLKLNFIKEEKNKLNGILNAVMFINSPILYIYIVDPSKGSRHEIKQVREFIEKKTQDHERINTTDYAAKLNSIIIIVNEVSKDGIPKHAVYIW